jgi:hypothetical protein
MGAWGPALFSDDTACDVRDEYRDLIADGLDDAEATRQVLERNADAMEDEDEAMVIWLALAVTQSRLGRLDAAVAGRALQIIDDGGDVRRWAEEEGQKRAAQRQAALAKARVQITGPQPPRRQLRHPATTLTPGDVLACPTRDGRTILLRVVRVHRGVPVVRLLLYAGTSIPPLDDIARLPDYLHVNQYMPDGYAVPFTMHKYKHRLPARRLPSWPATSAPGAAKTSSPAPGPWWTGRNTCPHTGSPAT